MKATPYYLVLLLMATAFTACKKDKIAYESEFDKSYNAWINFKASSNNSYIYQVSSSSWTGYNTYTTITVVDGRVTGRFYRAGEIIYPATDMTIREEWTEEQHTLNTHQSGAATLTLDEIYKQAKTTWLVKKNDSETYFESKNDGMISSCGFVPNGCQDDCFTGIKISFIEKLVAHYYRPFTVSIP